MRFPFGGASGGQLRHRRWRRAEITVADPDELRRSVAGTAVGNFMEWYDFGVYAYLATTLSKVFFPGDSSAAALLGTFGILAASFVVRPLGGVILGPLGDRIGRKRVLMITITLMAIATTITGLLPTYHDQGFWHVGFGVWAAILLLATRIVQGFSTGGEYVGAMTYIDEHAPDRRRGLLGGFLPVGTLAGYVCGAALVTILTATLSDDAMMTFGWRIPFMVGAPLAVIAMYMRVNLEETPAYQELSGDAGGTGESDGASDADESSGADESNDSEEGSGQLLRRAIADYWPTMLVVMGLVLTFNVTNYMLTGYIPTYLKQVVGIAHTPALAIVTVVLLILGIVVVFVARLSDRIGRKPVMWIGCGLLIVGSVPAILLMHVEGHYPVIFVGVLLVGVMLLCFNSTEPSTLPMLFPTKVRYGAVAVSFNIGVSAFGGTTPLIAEALMSATADPLIPAYILIVAGIVGVICVYLIPEPAQRRLPGSSPIVESEREARDVARSGTLEDPETAEGGVTTDHSDSE